MIPLNTWLDALPRTRFGFAGREWPAWRAMGVAGFYAAAVTLFGCGLAGGLSLVVLALLTLTCAGSFFVYAWLRRLVTGRENMVLLEHVWIALGASAAILYLMREPVLHYLDAAIPALCIFLAAGRIGCLLVGCCHGNPAEVGIRYGDAAVDEGLPNHLEGVRLFPVQAIESAGLLAIGAGGLALWPRSSPGGVLCWFVIAYGVLRTGLEGMRGDQRASWLRLSHAQWMSLIQVGAAIYFFDASAASHRLIAIAVAVCIVVAIAVRYIRDARRGLLKPEHIDEVRDLVLALGRGIRPTGSPTSGRSSRGVGVAVSPTVSNSEALVHVSLSLPNRMGDLKLLCELAARSLPELQPESGQYSPRHVLHLMAPVHPTGAPRASGAELYGSAVRRLQTPEPATESAGGTPIQETLRLRPWYFNQP